MGSDFPVTTTHRIAPIIVRGMGLPEKDRRNPDGVHSLRMRGSSRALTTPRRGFLWSASELMPTRNGSRMFEHYTPEARRSIEFAHAVSRVTSPVIEPGHVLLGLVRENIAFVNRFLITHVFEDWFQSQFMDAASPPPCRCMHFDVAPFSGECNRVLAFAAEEARLMMRRRMVSETGRTSMIAARPM